MRIIEREIPEEMFLPFSVGSPARDHGNSSGSGSSAIDEFVVVQDSRIASIPIPPISSALKFYTLHLMQYFFEYAFNYFCLLYTSPSPRD